MTGALPRGVTSTCLVASFFGQLRLAVHYREANRAVSRADFANKIGTVQKEAAETQYWIELLTESGVAPGLAMRPLPQESSELLAIFTTIGKNLKQ